MKTFHSLFVRCAVLMSFVAVWWGTSPGTALAATYYWDSTTTTGYQGGTGTWDSSSFWTLDGTTLTTWPGGTTHNAVFSTIGQTTNNLVSLTSITVNSLALGTATGQGLTIITNGTLTIGAGGVSVNNNNVTAQLWSDIVLGANQSWSLNYNLDVRGNISGSGGITKVGASTLPLYGTNSFSGDFIQGAGPVTVYSTSGLPLGSGSLTISDGLTLNITPAGSGSAVELQGGTNGNKTLSFDGYSRIYINKGSQTSVTYTFGNATDTGSVFNRIGKGTLAIGNQTSTTMIGDDYGRFLVANGAVGVPITNGMVDAYIVVEKLGSAWDFEFLQYDAVNGLYKLTYDGTFSGTSAGIQDSTKKYKVNNGSYPVLTGNTAVYALSLQGTSSLTLSNNATLTIGNGSRPAGLYIANGSLSRAANSSNSKLSFGSSEGILYTSNSGATIGVPVDGTGGLTVNAGAGTGAITLTNANTYSGDTTVIAGKLNVGSGGTSGDLGNSSNLVVYAGATLIFNRSDTVTWGNAMSGAGTVQNGGVGTLNLTPPSGTTFAGTLANASSGTMNLTLGNGNTVGTVQNSGVGTLTVSALSGASNTFVSIKNSSTGTLVLDGVGSTNVVTGPSPSFGGAAGGTLVFSNGYYVSQGGQRNTPGNLTVAGATLVVDANRLGINSSDGQQVNITSGSLVVTTNCGSGFLVGNDSGAGSTGNKNCTINQSGGSVIQYKGNNYLQIGGMTVSKTNAYYFSGGLMNLASGYNSISMVLGSDTAGTTLAQFSMTGGKLVAAGIIKGSQGTGARQVFDFSGGTLAADTVTATYLASTNAPTVQGTLVNNGGTLAPGDIGTAGLTTLTGNYQDNSPNAILALDVGGTAVATAFTNAGSYYDKLAITGSGNFSGKLSVSLINGYVPQSTATKFTNVTATVALSAGFNNVTGGKVWCADGYSRFDVLTNALPANSLILSNYTANAWNQASGNSWTNTLNWSASAEPNGESMGGFFGTALASSGNVTLDAARTVRSLYFTNNVASYTISGSSLLTLQGDAMASPLITVAKGSHTIAVPLALSSGLTIAVDNAADMLTISGNITGSQAVTKTGAGTLVMSGNNTLGSLTVSAGTNSMTGGTSSVGPLSLAANTVFKFSAGILNCTGLTPATGSTFEFSRTSSGILRILKGSAGGAIDTTNEVATAITGSLITKAGEAVPNLALFKLGDDGTTVTVQLKSLSTGSILKIY